MLPFRRILVPVDFSAPCRAVVPYVNDMASHYSADVVLLHVFEQVLPVYSEFGNITAADVNLDTDDELRTMESGRLREFAASAFGSRPVRSIVVEGEPGAAIHKVVQRERIDLVMMSTNGRGPFRRLLLGSVTAKVLHDTSCPVWTGVHSVVAGRQTSVPYRSIVCALGQADESLDVMKAAAAFAKSYEASLTFVHVVETPPVAWDVDFTPYRQQLIDSADLQLRGMAREAGIEGDVIVLGGSIAASIGREALERKADLLIVGRGHSQGGLSRIWSHLYEIVREAPCPVLSI